MCTCLLQYLFFNTPTLVGLFLLCTVMGVVLTGFTIYHIIMASANVTTNESFKWSSLERRVEYIRAQNEVALVDSTDRVPGDCTRIAVCTHSYYHSIVWSISKHIRYCPHSFEWSLFRCVLALRTRSAGFRLVVVGAWWLLSSGASERIVRTPPPHPLFIFISSLATLCDVYMCVPLSND